MNSIGTILIFVIGLILSTGFLILVITLIPTLTQFRFLMKDLEKTSAEIRDLTVILKLISLKVDKDIDKVDDVLDSSKDTVEVVKRSLQYIEKNFLSRSSKLVIAIPIVKFAWNFFKKFKRRNE